MFCTHGKIAGKTAMPPAIAYDNLSWPEGDTFIDVAAFDCLCVPVSDLRRSIGFYGELFAMRVVAGGGDAGRVVLSRGGRVRLALYAHSGAAAIPFTRVGARVESIEAARDTAWELGIDAVRELGEEGQDSFVIADPDGHEIRFFERSHRETRGHL